MDELMWRRRLELQEMYRRLAEVHERDMTEKGRLLSKAEKLADAMGSMCGVALKDDGFLLDECGD